MPPPPVVALAELPLTVQLVSVSDRRSVRPPPVPEAELPLTVQSVSVTEPPSLYRPPPFPVVEPSVMVRPLKLAVTPPSTWNTRLAPPPLTVSLLAPSPSIVTFTPIVSGPEFSVIVSPLRLLAKLIVSPLEAVVMAARSEPGPLSWLFMTVTVLSSVRSSIRSTRGKNCRRLECLPSRRLGAGIASVARYHSTDSRTGTSQVTPVVSEKRSAGPHCMNRLDQNAQYAALRARSMSAWTSAQSESHSFRSASGRFARAAFRRPLPLRTGILSEGHTNPRVYAASSLDRSAQWASLGAADECLDIGPERRPFLPLGLGELRAGLGIADADEVGVLLPALHSPVDRGAGNEIGTLKLLGVQGQVGAQPVEGLLAQAGALLVVELGRVLALAGGGQRGEAGGVVAVSGLEVVGQLGVGGEGGGVQAGRRVVELLDLAPLGQAEAFLVARRRVAAVLEGGELVPGRRQSLRLREVSLGRRRTSGRVRWPSLAGDGLVQLALAVQRNAQVVVGRWRTSGSSSMAFWKQAMASS